MKRSTISLVTLAAALVPLAAVEAAVIVYRDRSAWESAVGNAFHEEVFDDELLPPAVSVSSDNGFINTGKGAWLDRVDDSEMTTWTFATPILGFGANWDLVGPSGIRLSIDGQFVGQEISKGTKGEFFGITSDDFFQEVLVAGGTQGRGRETYEMDDMVYSKHAPEPSTFLVWSLLAALGIGCGWRRRR